MNGLNFQSRVELYGVFNRQMSTTNMPFNDPNATNCDFRSIFHQIRCKTKKKNSTQENKAMLIFFGKA